ncbi:MAG: apolipoprotein N-acyltransferase [Actinomycetota bacterium]
MLRALPPALAATSGLALLAAHPPLGWWPASFAAPALLVAALWSDAAARQRAGRGARGLRLGMVAGAVTFAPMLSWLILAAGYVGWGLLVLVQVLWMGLLGALLAPFRDQAWLPLGAAAVWTGIDAWRAIWPLGGFEWGAIAYAHVDGSWLAPIARLVGGRGITFLVVLIGVAAAMTVRSTWHSVRGRDGRAVEHALGATRWPVALLVGGLLVSVLGVVEPPEEDGSIEVLVVQGNDRRHWEDDSPDPDPPLRITTAMRDETLAAIERDGVPDVTVWPESSINRDPFSERGRQLGVLADEAADAAGTIIAGAVLDGPDPDLERYNAAIVLEDGLEETDRYVKRRPVPFGEYIPARPLLDWFPPLDQIPRDTIAGEGPQPLHVGEDEVPVSVIICFETKFQSLTRDNVLGTGDEPTQLLLTQTNDASFGDSAEPAQHLAQSRLRAIETGRHVVHGALTGSSAFVAPDGSVEDATEVFTIDSIRKEVPLVSGLTPYLVIGDVVGWLTRAVVVLAIVAVVLGRIARRRGGTLPFVHER